MSNEFKNYKRESVTIHSPNGMHSARFEPLEKRVVPAILADAALAAGLVPQDVIDDIAKREAEEAEENAKREAAEADEAKAAKVEAAQKLKEASERADKEVQEADIAKARSLAAKKAAATRKANAEKAKTDLATE